MNTPDPMASLADPEMLNHALARLFAPWVRDLDLRVIEARAGEVTLALEGTSAAELEAGDPAQTAARAVWELIWDPALKPREKAKQIAARTGLEARAVYERLARRGDEE